VTEKTSKSLTDKGQPKGLLRLFLRFPIILYKLKLGRLLGDRFLLLHHLGRKSGQWRQTVVEVVRCDPSQGVYIVASGWGETSNWFRNILKHPEIRIETARGKLDAVVERLDDQSAGRELRDYGRRNPAALRLLAKRMLGRAFSETDEDFLELSRTIPVILIQLERNKPRSTEGQ